MSDHEEPELKSKSQLKREMTALQDLGKKLTKLSAQQLQKIPLPDELHRAIDDARVIHSNSAMRRQMQYIGRLMRSADIEPIAAAIDFLNSQNNQANAHFHKLERWRDRLVAEGDTALSELLEAHPKADRQQLRQLIRNAQNESAKAKPPKSARQLFHILRELLEADDEQ